MIGRGLTSSYMAAHMTEPTKPPKPGTGLFPIVTPAEQAAVDPVCGMSVNAATARASTQHQGQTIYFCSPSCLQKFQANPERYLTASSRQQEDYAIDPVCGMRVDPESAAGSTVYEGKTYYFCNPHCLRKFLEDPQRYLQRRKSGSGSQPVPRAAQQASGSRIEYTCPMDPEVVSDRPGHCPKCGMALEPRTVVLEEGPNLELMDMS